MKARLNLLDLSRWVALPSLILVTMPCALGQEASTNTWTGSTSDDWNIGSNWNPTLPGIGAKAAIQNGNTVQISSNPVSVIDQLLINGSSTFNVGAILDITSPTSGSGLYVGASGSAGTVILNNSASLNIIGGNVGIGRGQTGSLNIGVGSNLLATNINEFHLGWDGGGDGTITQTGGTFTKTGGGDLRIGAFGGTGNYNISGGVANLENLRIAFAGSGAGTINQTGGTVDNQGELAIGWASSGAASYNISGGSLTSSQRIRFGIGSDVRNNRINQTGGSVTVTNGRVDIGEDSGPSNVYEMSGGTLSVNGDGRVLVGAFGASSGTFSISGNASVDLGNGFVLGDGGTAHGILNLNGGTVNVNRIVSGGSSSTQFLNMNGGTIVAKSSEGNMIAGDHLVATLQAGGVTINSNGFDIGVTIPLSGVGGLTKTGANQLKLLGTNSYSGNTVIDEGQLTLIDSGTLSFFIGADGVNNRITGDGDGTLNVLGTFNFDLANAASQGMWNLVDVANLGGVNYGATFGVNGWTETGLDSNVWTFNRGTSLFTFNGANGILSAVPEPSSALMALAGLGSLLIFRRRGC